MREAIGGTWLFGLVITFIVFFASFLAISVNYAKAFNVKNNVVDLITKYEGNNCNARSHISEYLSDVGYLVPGVCPSNGSTQADGYSYTGYDLSGNKVADGKKAYFCVSNNSYDNTTLTSGGSSNDELERQFYRVIVFFRVDLPVVGELTTFRIKGETESIYFANNDTKNTSACSK